MTAIFAVAIALLGVAGCGYNRAGDDKSLYRADVHTVAVPIFTNKSFRRGVEFQLSKAVVNQLEMRTPYKVVSKEKADTILEGEIRDIRLSTVSLDNRTAIPQEQLYVITMDLIWKDMRTGRILVERRNFEQTTTYFPTLGEEFAGSQQAVERLALGVVQELQADW